MKILSIVAIILAFGYNAFSQPFLRTYTKVAVSGVDENTIGKKVALFYGGGPDYDLVVFSVNTMDQNGAINGVDLIVADGYGDFLHSIHIPYNLDHHHIATTADGSLLFAGYSSELNNSAALHVYKFSVNASSFSQIWGSIVDIMPKAPIGSFAANISDWQNVDIETIHDPVINGENYYISFTEGSTTPGYENMPSLGLVKFDNSGSLIWHYLYENPNHSFQTHASTSFDIAGNGVQLSIAGTLSPLLSNNPWGFRFGRPTFITIDQNGTPQTSFVGHWPLSDNENRPDILWDGEHFVSIFSSATSVSGSYPVRSTIGILKMDVNYTLVDHAFYWGLIQNDIWGYGNRGNGVTLDQNGNYIFSGWMDVGGQLPATSPPTVDFMDVPILFKFLKSDPLNMSVNATMYPESFSLTSHPYNFSYESQFHITDPLDNSFLVPTRIESGKYNPRLLKVDMNLDNCQQEGLVLYSQQDYMRSDPYYFSISSFNVANPDALEMPLQTYYTTDCRVGKPSVTQANEIKSQQFSINPTIVGRDDEKVICTFATELKDASITVSNMLGQVIFKSDISSGNRFELPTLNLQSGINLIKIASDRNQIYTAKIVKE